jgi:caffeoyl-CoA O-methyltransferase
VANRTITLTDGLYDYLLDVSLREPDVLRRLREETAKIPAANMQIAPEQGQFMALLVELMEARKAIEVGTFTGYSSLSVALALPPGGRLVTCDVNEEWTAVARRYWAEAGVADRIDLRLGPALETLDALIAEGEEGTFDFAFIDADKAEYDAYYERILTLLRPGGLVSVDNVLWSGRVLDTAKQDPDTRAIRAFNEKIHADPRVSLSLVPIGDGLTLARKRP